MAINPISYTEQVVSDFLRYQLTAYPFADEHLHSQMRQLLSISETMRSPLVKGPYISLSRAFKAGVAVRDLVAEGVLHPFMENLIPYQALFGHQEKAIRAIVAGKSTLISTGTGSGKTECFLYPVISRCLGLRDKDAKPGIVAVLVYPMNALAEDQLIPIARTAFRHRNSVRNVRGQDTGKNRRCRRRAASSGIVPGSLSGGTGARPE
jgi:ATP-dependent helicase YprA (DUF1998 family)